MLYTNYTVAMECSILYIGHSPVRSWLAASDFSLLDIELSYHLIEETTVEAGSDHLFSSAIGILILDSDLQGAEEAVRMIKNEEMVKYVQIMVINVANDLETAKRFYLAGAEQVVALSTLNDEQFLPHLRPLVINYQIVNEKILKTSDLQEKAINDFILLDLIKAYVSKTIWNVAKECAKNQKLEIPEIETEATVVFGDVKGFTKMSQHLKPKAVIELLNTVYEVVTRRIYENGGDIDKFVGDAFYGIFKDPKDAIRAMLLIQKELEEKNKVREANGEILLQFRIGIHTGPVIRGNVGAHNRFDHTMIGDTVNTASRLEHIAPVGDVVVSEDSKNKAGIEIPEDYSWTEVLRGRDCAIKVYRIFDCMKNNTSFLSQKSKNILED